MPKKTKKGSLTNDKIARDARRKLENDNDDNDEVHKGYLSKEDVPALSGRVTVPGARRVTGTRY